MALATVLCWISLGFVMLNVDPFFASVPSFIFFYVSLFLSLLGSISMIACTYYYFFSSRDLPMFRYVRKSFRTALIFSVSIVSFLLLQANHVLTSFTGTLFLIVFALVLVLSFSFDGKQTYEES